MAFVTCYAIDRHLATVPIRETLYPLLFRCSGISSRLADRLLPDSQERSLDSSPKT